MRRHRHFEAQLADLIAAALRRLPNRDVALLVRVRPSPAHFAVTRVTRVVHPAKLIHLHEAGAIGPREREESKMTNMTNITMDSVNRRRNGSNLVPFHEIQTDRRRSSMEAAEDAYYQRHADGRALRIASAITAVGFIAFGFLLQ